MEKLGLTLDKLDSWTPVYQKAKAFFESHGHLEPKKTENFQLHNWLYNQRKAYKEGRLSANQIKLLNSIQMPWVSSLDRAWEEQYETLCKYIEIHKSEKRLCQEKRGCYTWLNHQKDLFERDALSDEKAARLQAIGIMLEKNVKPMEPKADKAILIREKENALHRCKLGK